MHQYSRLSDAHVSSPSGISYPKEYRVDLNLTPEQTRDPETLLPGERSPFSHLTRLSIPPSQSQRGFRFRATGHLWQDLSSIKIVCDSINGISGRNDRGDPIIADFVMAGRMDFTQGGQKFSVLPGQVFIRDAKMPWRFHCAPATTMHMVSIPRHLVLSRIGSSVNSARALLLNFTDPKIMLLKNLLTSIDDLPADSQSSSPFHVMTQEICVTILASILLESAKSITGRSQWDISDRAKEAIENDIGNADLSPVVIAASIGVSVRTLHRAFSAANDSMMAFVRRTRLQLAHDDLVGSAHGGVSEIAARWHFSDASHFIKHFKSTYGATPAVYLRRVKSRQGDL
ncbi:AraC family transcriptional regulator [Streptomyces sp. NBC_01275]|uniref:helix-turn-helix domain-containing protein n=1 Tax=Streptomyces sp. NBC_01275 TaxID=2903807 RepID=UPI0022553CB4|nr:helix-turn-helix domain-containing protein [Streptomyces sp. NBC_01275]MCX4760392.1 AraC family transcriptional regulator [Streptomyces sp. NBC_01275]